MEGRAGGFARGEGSGRPEGEDRKRRNGPGSFSLPPITYLCNKVARRGSSDANVSVHFPLWAFRRLRVERPRLFFRRGKTRKRVNATSYLLTKFFLLKDFNMATGMHGCAVGDADWIYRDASAVQHGGKVGKVTVAIRAIDPVNHCSWTSEITRCDIILQFFIQFIS